MEDLVRQPTNNMDNKQQFLEIYKKFIKRDGADKLLDWLVKSDFFEAPASTKFHNAKPEGLCEHSVNVYFRLRKLVDEEKKIHPNLVGSITDESVAIVALLHDVCKANMYVLDYRNVKVDGNWEKVPYYTIDDQLPYGHGEKSVYIVNGFLRLSREEAMAINWHMGGFDKRVVGGDFGLSKAFEQFPLACLTNIADMMATYLDEDRD